MYERWSFIQVLSLFLKLILTVNIFNFVLHMSYQHFIHFCVATQIKVPSGTEVVTLRLKKRSNDFWLVVLEKKI